MAFLLVNDFSKKDYKAIRATCIKQNSSIFPCYDVVARAKLQCRPAGIISTASKVFVPLSSLINHTVQRIISCNLESFEELCENDGDAIQMSFLFSAGCDGTTGCAQYNQELSKNINDSSMIATVINPLRIISGDKIYWQNPSPHSPSMIRPLEIRFEKETKITIKEIKKKFDIQREDLEDVLITLPSGKKLFIKAVGFFSMIDGKVLNHITDTSAYSVCPHCGASPKAFNQLSNFTDGKFTAKESTFEYGLSDLHVKIRLFEAVLHLSYSSVLPPGKWQVRGEVNKKNVAARKKIIQGRFKSELNLIVDMPRGNGAGTSNTGNTCRRAFADTEKLSQVLEIDVNLLNQLRVIMEAVSCELPIDAVKFEEHCKKTFASYISLFPGRPMTVTLHRLLLHGSQIIAFHILPVGFLSEEGAESKNKIYKKDRLQHARKISHEENLLDTFHRSMDTSDPVVAQIAVETRKTHIKHLRLSEDVKKMLMINNENDENPLGELMYGNDQRDEVDTERECDNFSLLNSDIIDELA